MVSLSRLRSALWHPRRILSRRRGPSSPCQHSPVRRAISSNVLAAASGREGAVLVTAETAPVPNCTALVSNSRRPSLPNPKREKRYGDTAALLTSLAAVVLAATAPREATKAPTSRSIEARAASRFAAISAACCSMDADRCPSIASHEARASPTSPRSDCTSLACRASTRRRSS